MSAPLPVRTAVTVQGWGSSNIEEAGTTLTQIDVAIRSQEECNYVYNNTERKVRLGLELQLPQLVTESMFCADSTLNTGEVGTNNYVLSMLFIVKLRQGSGKERRGWRKVKLLNS